MTKTIGEFYDSILEGFEALFEQTDALFDVFPSAKQLEHEVNRPSTSTFPKGRGVFKITNLDDVRYAIALIKRQGEGYSIEGRPSSGEPAGSPEDESASDLAHYYRLNFKNLMINFKCV